VLSDQPLAAYERFARICTLSLTLVGTRFYLSRSRETRRELREKQMKLSELLPISTAPPRRTSFSRRNSSPALKATRGNIHVTLNLFTAWP